jgi:hypothetical protein
MLQRTIISIKSKFPISDIDMYEQQDLEMTVAVACLM